MPLTLSGAKRITKPLAFYFYDRGGCEPIRSAKPERINLIISREKPTEYYSFWIGGVTVLLLFLLGTLNFFQSFRIYALG